MKTLDDIHKTPVQLLTPEEIEQMAPRDQNWAKAAQAQAARERNCPGHEAIGTETRAEAMRGWHPAHCKHCGMDMSIDSGD